MKKNDNYQPQLFRPLNTYGIYFLSAVIFSTVFFAVGGLNGL